MNYLDVIAAIEAGFIAYGFIAILGEVVWMLVRGK